MQCLSNTPDLASRSRFDPYQESAIRNVKGQLAENSRLRRTSRFSPGLVDIHVDVFWGIKHAVSANGDHSLQPDAAGFRTGVTTMVDAGTSGWRDFPEFRRRIIDSAQTRVLALISIVGAGMAGRG